MMIVIFVSEFENKCCKEEANLLACMTHEHVARRFAILKHVSGGRIEQREKDIIGAEHQALVLR